MKHDIREIKALFFPRWDRQNLWRISTRSRRRAVDDSDLGYCDTDRQVIAMSNPHFPRPEESI